MKTYICDNEKCGKTITKTVYHVTIDDEAVSITRDYCGDCYNKLIKGIDDAFNNSEDNSSESSSKKIKNTSKQRKSKSESNKSNDDSDYHVKTDSKTAEENKEDTEETKENTLEDAKDEYVDKNRLTSKEKILAYGVKNIENEYRNTDIKMVDLASKVGVPRATLAKFLQDNNMHKAVGRYASVKNTNSTEERKEFSIEKHGAKYKSLLRKSEQTTTDTCHDCIRCAYRNKEIGHCWYTMITDSRNSVRDNTCKHFVDIGKLNL